MEKLVFSDYGGEMLRKHTCLRSLYDGLMRRLASGKGQLFSCILRKPSTGAPIVSRSLNRKEPHVLHVVPGLEPGGMELTLARLVEATEGKGIRHTIVCLKGEVAIPDQFPASVAIHCLHSRRNDPLLPWRLWRLIRQIRPTVIHARNWGAWPDVALARLFVWPLAPLIFSFHGFAGTRPLPLRRRLGVSGAIADDDVPLDGV